jgi:hypothetical protein
MMKKIFPLTESSTKNPKKGWESNNKPISPPPPPKPPPMLKLREGIDKMRKPDVPVPFGPIIDNTKTNTSIFSKISNIVHEKLSRNKIETLQDIINNNEGKNKYLIVLHNYWMTSKGFEKFIIEADSESQADKEAALLAYKRIKTFNHCNYIVIKL